MSKPLTAAAVAKMKPGNARREIPDGGCPGLYLVIQPAGAKGRRCGIAGRSNVRRSWCSAALLRGTRGSPTSCRRSGAT